MSVDSFLSLIVDMMVSTIESVRFATFEEGQFQCRFVSQSRYRYPYARPFIVDILVKIVLRAYHVGYHHGWSAAEHYKVEIMIDTLWFMKNTKASALVN
jgi:hypothetical protein